MEDALCRHIHTRVIAIK